ncbi:MAG: DUF3800 domain-containing protein [Armatimonadetes bacterium]|nr:DUF3800 domain-containing protein [Armatimonadota bacterium]
MLSNHSNNCVFYIDESGDLGFGTGSSNYFVLAIVCVDSSNNDKLKRYVRKFRMSMRLPAGVEMKASNTNSTNRVRFLDGLSKLPCSFHYIVVNKSKVQQPLKRDTNILYNYVSGLVLVPMISILQQATVNFDCRTIKVASGNSLGDYLCTKLWGEMSTSVDVKFSYVDSARSEGVQAADFVANAVFRNYERGNKSGYAKIAGKIGHGKRLFF